MAFYGKEYKCHKHENFDGFLRAAGLPEDKIKAFDSYKPTTKLVKNSDGTYTSITTINGKTTETTFTPGVEFDDVIGEDKTPIKSVYSVDGNTVTQVIKSPMGQATFKKEYNGDELIVTITGDKFDGVAKRFYKAT